MCVGKCAIIYIGHMSFNYCFYIKCNVLTNVLFENKKKTPLFSVILKKGYY